MKELLQYTAWPMTAPKPYSAFHILISLAGIGLAVFLARRLRRVSEGALLWLLFFCGLIWHILLVFIGLLIGFHGSPDLSVRGFADMLPLFGACCLTASFINVYTHPLGDADMFYISPYYPTTQIVFHDIALRFGIMAGNVIYLLSICLGGFLCHLFIRRMRKTRFAGPV